MMTALYTDGPVEDLDTYVIESRDGERIEFDSLTQEVIRVSLDKADAILPMGKTYRLKEQIVYRDWPSVDVVISNLQAWSNAQ